MRYQLRLLLLSVAGVVLIVVSAFVVDWHVIHVGNLHDVQIDLRRVRVCAPQCFVHDVSTLTGSYPGLATLAFWSSMPLFVAIATQTGARLLSGFGYQFIVKLGTGLGAVTFFCAFGAGYIMAPEDASIAGFQLFTVERGWGPLCMVLGAIFGMIAIRYAMIDPTADDVGEYKPVVIPKVGDSKDGSTRLPVTPISVNKLPTPPAGAGPAARTKAPSQAPAPAARPRPPSQPQPPVVARTTSPQDVRPKSQSQAPLGDARLKKAPTQSPQTPGDARPKSPSHAPLAVDVAARLGAVPVEVTIRPPLPEPASVPEDQIPVAPESGLVIRKRSTSQAPEGNLPLPPDVGMTIRTRPPSVAPVMMPSVASALGVAKPSEPTPGSQVVVTLSPVGPALPPTVRINYAVTTAAFSSEGMTATREDGLAKLIAWREVVGIVARRLPQSEPYHGLTFVDIVSSAGSTMRLLPHTEISGHSLGSDHTERARRLVNLLASQALDAKLDTATRVFATGTSKAAQLKDEQTLATHDARLA